jgi:hypothetical protein
MEREITNEDYHPMNKSQSSEEEKRISTQLGTAGTTKMRKREITPIEQIAGTSTNENITGMSPQEEKTQSSPMNNPITEKRIDNQEKKKKKKRLKHINKNTTDKNS